MQHIAISEKALSLLRFDRKNFHHITLISIYQYISLYKVQVIKCTSTCYVLYSTISLCESKTHLMTQQPVFMVGIQLFSEWRHTCFKTGVTLLIKDSDVLATGFRGYDGLWSIKEPCDICAVNLKLTVHFIEALRKYFWQCQVTKVFFENITVIMWSWKPFMLFIIDVY